MTEIPIPEGSPTSEWVRSVAQAIDEDEQTIRGLVSASSPTLSPDDDDKESALKDVITDSYYKTKTTPFDNSPESRVWIQFPSDGELGAYYEYRCWNPPHPPPEQANIGTDRNWTYTAHTVTTVTPHLRDVMRDIDYIQLDSRRTVCDTEFTDDRITIVRTPQHPDLPTVTRILTDGFGLDFADIADAYGRFRSEWSDTRLYWND